MIYAYCDGAASKNGTSEAVGGWGYVLLANGLNENNVLLSRYGGKVGATNQQMELMACIKALTQLHELHTDSAEEIIIRTDSAYVCNCFKRKWYEAWQKNGWKNANNVSVANQDLWKRLLLLVELYPSLKWEKVRGHSGDRWNEEADKLAVTGRNLVI